MRQLLRLIPLLLCMAACKGVQTTLDPAADQSVQSDLVWRAMLAVCGFMYVLTMAFLGWALWRSWRNRPVDPPAGQQQTERALGLGLTAWAGLIVAGLSALVLISYGVDRRLGQIGPDPIRVKVTASQWWWRIEYEGETPSRQVVTANELHLPAGRPAIIDLNSNDVIHSFWVPNLSGKEDLIPGRTNHLPITPRRLGVFRGECAEFCGLEHAKMAFKAMVDTPQQFEAWREAQLTPAPAPTDPQAAAGEQVFMTHGCATCHRIDGTEAGATLGPDLTHLASRTTLAAGMLPNTPTALRDWIADPQKIKDGALMPKVPLSETDRSRLVAYLETLR